jgi:hypothetical protein
LLTNIGEDINSEENPLIWDPAKGVSVSDLHDSLTSSGVLDEKKGCWNWVKVLSMFFPCFCGYD